MITTSVRTGTAVQLYLHQQNVLCNGLSVNAGLDNKGRDLPESVDNRNIINPLSETQLHFVPPSSIALLLRFPFAAKRYASAIICCRSVSVYPSDTSRHCSKTAKASIMQTTADDSAETLVF